MFHGPSVLGVCKINAVEAENAENHIQRRRLLVLCFPGLPAVGGMQNHLLGKFRQVASPAGCPATALVHEKDTFEAVVGVDE